MGAQPSLQGKRQVEQHGSPWEQHRQMPRAAGKQAGLKG